MAKHRPVEHDRSDPDRAGAHQRGGAGDGIPPKRLVIRDEHGDEVPIPSTVTTADAMNAFLQASGHHHDGLDPLGHFLGHLLNRTVRIEL